MCSTRPLASCCGGGATTPRKRPHRGLPYARGARLRPRVSAVVCSRAGGSATWTDPRPASKTVETMVEELDADQNGRRGASLGKSSGPCHPSRPQEPLLTVPLGGKAAREHQGALAVLPCFASPPVDRISFAEFHDYFMHSDAWHLDIHMNTQRAVFALKLQRGNWA